MKTAIKTTLAVVASAAAIAGVATIPSIVSAWGDNSESGHRSTYSLQYINEHAEDFGKTPFFNSIKLTGTREDQYKERVEGSDYWWYPQTHKDAEGNPIYLQEGLVSDETDFVGIREDTGVDAGPKNVWYNDIEAKDGKTYIIRLYVHNNNPYGTEAVAENTRIRFSFPTSSSRNAQVLGFITSDASPSSYHDYANFYSNTHSFHLEYVEDSALFESKGAAGGSKLNDKELVNDPAATGILIGYNALDGRVPGCYQYTTYTTIKVKVVFDREFNIETKVRVVGDSDKSYKAAVNANIGDTVEYQIEYKNTSDKMQNQVAIRDILPANMEYVPGSTKVYNANHASGIKIVEDTIVENGIIIGNYGANSNAFIRFRAVVKDVNLACGSNALVNWGQGQADASTQVILQDKATVYTVKVCPNTPEEPTDPVKQLPNTGPEAIAGGIIAAGSIATAAGYYIASRRQLR